MHATLRKRLIGTNKHYLHFFQSHNTGVRLAFRPVDFGELPLPDFLLYLEMAESPILVIWVVGQGKVITLHDLHGGLSVRGKGHRQNDFQVA